MDPAVGGQVAKRRAAKLKQRMADQDAWEAENGTESDPEVFRREILPKLPRLSLTAMAKATGLSIQYCSLIRRGQCVPHRRHWIALTKIAGR